MEPHCCHCAPAAGGETDRQELKLVPFGNVTDEVIQEYIRLQNQEPPTDDENFRVE